MSNAYPLKRVTKFVGNSVLVDDDPMIECYRDVLCVPSGIPDASPGLFDRGRKMLGAAADYRAEPHPKQLYAPYTTFDPEQFEYADDAFNYVFLGAITGHYGHFITASMARLWALRLASSPYTRYIVLNPLSIEAFLETEFIAEIFGAAGLTAASFLTVDRPVRFRRITVPSPAIEEHNFSHRVFGSLCARIGDVLVPEPTPTNDTPVFLSKSVLTSGVSKIVNEKEFLDHLMREGVEIVNPETMSMREKIAMFRSRSLVTGLAGSGLHTGVFTPNRDRLALNTVPTLLTNQMLLDQVSGCTTTTYMAESILMPETANWQNSYQLVDPRGTAEAFLSLIEHELRPRIAQRHENGGALPPQRGRLVGQFVFERENTEELAKYEGWCEMEPSQCWTSRVTSFFELSLLPSQGDLTLSLIVSAALAAPYLTSRPLKIFVNDVEVATHTINRRATYICTLPQRCVVNDVLYFRFEHPVTASPYDLGQSQDMRPLSISFEQIIVNETLL